MRPPLIGTTAPGFVAREPDGDVFQFDPTALEKPVILVFYRGGWCPYCNAQLMELRKAETELGELGYDILFLSADSPESLAAGMERESQYTLLSDNDLDAAKAFGIAFRVDNETAARYREHGIDLQKSSGRDHQALPVPAVFIINTAGTIAFHYVNVDYRQRIPPELLLSAARMALDARNVRERTAEE